MILWTVARQDPLSMGFSRQEYWIGLPCPLPDLQPTSLMSPHWHLGSFPLAPPRKYTLWINTIVTHPDEWDDNGVGSFDLRCSVNNALCCHLHSVYLLACVCTLVFLAPRFFLLYHSHHWSVTNFLASCMKKVITGVLRTFWLAV